MRLSSTKLEHKAVHVEVMGRKRTAQPSLSCVQHADSFCLRVLEVRAMPHPVCPPRSAGAL